MTEYLGGKNSLGRNLTMMTDFYELTMMQGYLRHGLADNVGVFDMFFRSRSDGQIMYAVMAGVEQLCEYIENLHFDEEDVDYLRSQNVFDEEFLKRLSDFEFTGEIYAVPEGTPVFVKYVPGCARAKPMLRSASAWSGLRASAFCQLARAASFWSLFHSRLPR